MNLSLIQFWFFYRYYVTMKNIFLKIGFICMYVSLAIIFHSIASFGDIITRTNGKNNFTLVLDLVYFCSEVVIIANFFRLFKERVEKSK
jgi:hypothetical protein